MVTESGRRPRRSTLRTWLAGPARDHRVYLRGGPALEGPRLSALHDGGTEIAAPSADGGVALFRITGDFELVEGRPRRVFEFVEDVRAPR